MSTDPLDSMVRLRQMAVDEARRDLSDALARERAGRDSAGRADDAITEEATAAERLTGDDATVEAFAAWLPTGRAAQQAAAAVLAAAEARVTAARAALTLSRAALRAAEELVATRETERQIEAQRREQLRLDEIGASRPALDD